MTRLHFHAREASRNETGGSDEDPPFVCDWLHVPRETLLNRAGLMAARQSAISLMRGPTFFVAAIAPLMFAGLAGAAAPQSLAPAPASRNAAVMPVAAVAPASRGPLGPQVAAVARPPSIFHIVATPVSAPPPSMAVKPTGALGIPMTALAAYRNAEQMMAARDPACGISWNLLAGIGRIESGHANGGATDAGGHPIQPIYGPALDGTLPGNEIIVQSEVSGRVTYARAVGPMQFLPGTWARFAADGDGDGVADPQNLYDSTLAAARYLCSGGLNLRDSSQAMAAILRYNNSTPYARNVLGWAAAYATGVVPVDLPPLTGSAPLLGDVHMQNPEGLGPGLPANFHGLPATDPLANMPLIDFDHPTGVSNGQSVDAGHSSPPDGPDCSAACAGPPPGRTPK